MATKKVKTNAIRLLEAAKVPFEVLTYPVDESDLSGVTAAQKMGLDPDTVFKTLVLRGERTGILVCIIPVAQTVDLKALASACGDKKVEMVHMREIQGLTGYIRGGCSPVGMKKNYPTYLDSRALTHPAISVSGGARGVQLRLAPGALTGYLKCETGSFCLPGADCK
ncbi:Cys-tRNA(Pro)/Cys-tRNA(Cys) deacylase ybaK [uncultured Clostridium sp.]|nr:Cys-tRNA(Pro)/Cys-tRNA(Cys) deacylase ybaK [uncultured Clostridium sp.]